MQKFVLKAVACAALAVVVSGVVLAGEAPQAPETRRIGVVYLTQVLQNYTYAKDSEERMKANLLPESTRIESEIARIQELERSLQNNPLKPQGGAPWRKSMMEIEAAKLEVSAAREEFTRRYAEEEFAFLQNMYAAFQRACKIIGDYYQYDIILTAPEPTLPEEVIRAGNPGLIIQEISGRHVQFVHDRANLTKSILDLMNHRYQLHLQDPQKNPL